MAAQCPVGFNVDQLREHVRTTYDRVARDPSGDFHFHRGADYAARYLGYDAAELAALPRMATDRFAGVANPFLAGPIHRGETVLDHACGAGTDLLIAARRLGDRGLAIGVDMTEAMRTCAVRAALEAGLEEIVDVRAGVYEELPVTSGTVDVVLSNGVLNLAPDKLLVLAEIFRVLKPGGRLYLADVVVARELRAEARESPELWAACVGGALPEDELPELSREAGLTDCQIIAGFDSFANTSAKKKVSKDLRVHGVTFFARKP